MYPDSYTYIAPAENLVRHGAFSRETAPPYVWEPYRTPGYPLLISAFIAAGAPPTSVLLCVPFLGALLAYSLVGFTWELLGDMPTARVAGIITAFFPNGWGLSTAILTDFLNGCCFIFAFVATCRAIRHRKWGTAVLAAALWMGTQLIRPTLSIAALLIGFVALWLARERRQIAIAAFLVVMTFPAPLYMSWQNLRAHNVFTPSLLGEVAMAEYVIPRGEALATGKDFPSLQEEAHRQDAEALARSKPGRNYYGRLHGIERQRSRRTLARYRPYVVLALALEAGRQTLAPWDMVVVALFGRTVWSARVVCGLAYLLFLGFAILGSSIAMRRSGFGAPAVLWLMFAFWIATGSLSAFAGSRYRFPGDLVLIPLAALGTTGAPVIAKRLRFGRALNTRA